MDVFSGALRLTDLNDFIAPTQECIKPVKIERKGGKPGSIKISSSGDYAEVDNNGAEVKLAKAQITLNDCLACSGCVTSAETVLIQQQSTEELCRVLENNSKVENEERKFVVVSVSHQSIASLAVRFGLSMDECQGRLTGFLKSLGVDLVLDLSVASSLSLQESQREFVNRLRYGERKNVFPMLASACPGWICYAEKTHGSFVLPYISTTKSPQQVMGSLVKDYLARHEDKTPNNVYHVTLMMCYDKKLEASREDFYDDLYRTRDVDLVITSVEVEQMLEKRLQSLNDCVMMPFDSLPGLEAIHDHYGGSAGGYLESIFRFAAKEIYGHEVDRMEYKVTRNQDFREVTLQLDGEPKLQFAAAYGFRNIQNIVQKLKRGKCAYDFVEIMACPSACINGGGQIRAPDPADSKSWLKNVEHEFDTVERRNFLHQEVIEHLYVSWLNGRDSPKSLKMLHTQYHSLENRTNNLNIKW